MDFSTNVLLFLLLLLLLLFCSHSVEQGGLKDREIKSLRRQLDSRDEELAEMTRGREVALKENRRLQADLNTMTEENQVHFSLCKFCPLRLVVNICLHLYLFPLPFPSLPFPFLFLTYVSCAFVFAHPPFVHPSTSFLFIHPSFFRFAFLLSFIRLLLLFFLSLFSFFFSSSLPTFFPPSFHPPFLSAFLPFSSFITNTNFFM